MIKSDIVDGIAVLTLTHGKANALDIELCDALAARFKELRKSVKRPSFSRAKARSSVRVSISSA
jgi:enoyl-CoA hydratase/carnithine racemase